MHLLALLFALLTAADLGGPSIGFDDMLFVPELGRVVVPGARSGKIVLIDPRSGAMTSIDGFSRTNEPSKGHDYGVTSADFAHGRLYVTDRTTEELLVVDVAKQSVVARAKLAGSPDYVRWVEATREVWVTEPERESIEIFSGEKHSGAIAVAGGPESLVIRGDRAYSNLWKGSTVAIDVRRHAIVSTWTNGCEGSRGLTEAGGHLFVGCAEGEAMVLDAKSGAHLAAGKTGAGVDLVDYRDGRLFAAAGRAGTLTVFDVDARGRLSNAQTLGTAAGSHCVAAVSRERAYVCDPRGGKILAVTPSR